MVEIFSLAETKPSESVYCIVFWKDKGPHTWNIGRWDPMAEAFLCEMMQAEYPFPEPPTHWSPFPPPAKSGLVDYTWHAGEKFSNEC